jgi:hypothetical protein
MSLQKTFKFTNNCNKVAEDVFIPTVGNQTEGVFISTIQEANKFDKKAVLTVFFSSPTINYVKNYSFVPSGNTDLTIQGYAYLQTLPEFFGAITV